MNRVHRDPAISPELAGWDVVKATAGWSALLVGNGASRAVWDGFAYQSLYSKACGNGIASPLGDAEQAVFDWARTSNFELVLQSLATARAVCQALGIDAQQITPRYDRIRRALIEAVRATHIAWPSVPQRVLRAIRRELLEYDTVYSTNYDLLVYWSMMSEEGGEGFVDFFWNDHLAFSLTDVEVWRKATKIFFLHGALHLYRLSNGQTVKRRASGGNLLRLFAVPYLGAPVPLFISEGQADEKLRSIRRSDYLSYCLSQLATDRGPLVVFGSSLGDQDSHIVNAIKSGPRRPVAVGLQSASPADNIASKARMHSLLPGFELHFYDVATHPLGALDLKVQE